MALTPEEQLELLHQAREGSPRARDAAFSRLLADFRPHALAVIHRALATAGLGADHAEEAWLQATFKFFSAGLEGFRYGAALRSYFVQIALHAAIDVVRQSRRFSSIDVTDGAALPESLRNDSAESLFVAEEQRRATLRTIAVLRACIEELSEIYRAPTELYYLRQTGIGEVCARQLGISKEAFEQRLARARRKLAACLRSKEGHGDE